MTILSGNFSCSPTLPITDSLIIHWITSDKYIVVTCSNIVSMWSTDFVWVLTHNKGFPCLVNIVPKTEVVSSLKLIFMSACFIERLEGKVVHCCNIYFYGYHIIGSVYWCLCFLCGIESFSITKGIYFRGWVISLLCIVESANIVVIIVVYLLGLLRYSLIAYDFSILTD